MIVVKKDKTMEKTTKKKIILTTKDIALMGVFIALIIVGGFIKIPTPLVPVTMQFFFCLLSGLLLGGIKGSLCVIIYVFMGLIGIPVFTAGGGFSYVLYPTFGYIIGFILEAFIAGSFVTFLKRKNKLKFIYVLLVCIACLTIVYIIGVNYMFLVYKLVKGAPIAMSKAWMSGCVIFLPTDISWCVVASFVSIKLIPFLSRIIKDKGAFSMKKFIAIKNKVLKNEEITKEEAMYISKAPLNVLTKAADEIRKHFVGDGFDFCSIINAKSGKCPEDCKFCAQSCHYKTNIEEYDLLDKETIIKKAQIIADNNIKRFSIVTSGRKLSDKDIDSLVDIVKELIEKFDFRICVSIGLTSKENLIKLKNAGVDRIHNNLETSEKNFKNICTTHTFEDKVNEILLAKSLGFSLCSGGIFGIGESMEDRVDMALKLRQLQAASVPINMLNPIKNTPFENNKILDKTEIQRIVAIYRFILPKAQIRLAGGRSLMEDYGYGAFLSGANSTITGNLLTTEGITIDKDKEKIMSLGFKI